MEILDKTLVKTIEACRLVEQKAFDATVTGKKFFVSYCFETESSFYESSGFGAYDDHFRMNAIADSVLIALEERGVPSADAIDYFCNFLKKKVSAKSMREKGIDETTIMRVLEF